MLKSKEKQQQNSHTERRRATLMIWAIVFVGVILCINMVSALTFTGLKKGEYYNTNDDYSNYFSQRATDGKYSCQVFTIGDVGSSSDFNVSGVSIKIAGDIDWGAPEKVGVFIVNLTGADNPNILNSNGIIMQNITETIPVNATQIWQNFSFENPKVLDVTKQYALCLNTTRADTNQPLWRIDLDGTYGGGDFFVYDENSHGTWNVSSKAWPGQTADAMFEIWGKRGAVSISLNFPTNNSVITDIGSNFTTTGMFILAPTFNWTNVTYYIWTNTGLFNKTFIDIPNNRSFTNTTYIDDFILGNYHWNANGCYGNSTESHCVWATNNYTFTVGASISNLTYNSTAYETSKQYFSGILELLPGTDLYDVKVIYNGTEHDGSLKLLGGDKYLAYSSFDINSVSSVTNYSFYFRLIYSLGAGAFLYQNSTEFYQNVYPINFSQCSAGNITLNFSAYNEEDLTSINNFSFYATFEYWLGSGDVRKNFSISNSSVPNNLLFCMNPNLTYYSDAKIQYEKTGYVKRSYYLINSSLTNTTNNIGLYLLNKSVSTSFIINIIDDVQFAVENAYIYIQRYYPGTGLFHTIEMAKTDNSGNTIGHFEAETEDYKVIIFKDGVILYESEMAKVFCGETPCTLNFQTEPAAAITWKNIGDLANLIWSLVYNEATKIWTYTYVDTSGTTNYGRLLVYTDDGNSRIVICNNTDTSSAATLTCNVTDYKGAIYAEAYISRSPEILVWLESIIESTAKAIFGMEGLFWATIILLIIGLIGTWNPSIGIVMMIAGIILISYLQIASFGITTIIGITFIGLLLLWEIKK